MERQLPSRGSGFQREEFYSFHSNPNRIAGQVRTGDYSFGAWVNVWQGRAYRLLWVFCPPLWRWWANRPNSKSRKAIEAAFPNLRGK